MKSHLAGRRGAAALAHALLASLLLASAAAHASEGDAAPAKPAATERPEGTRAARTPEQVSERLRTLRESIAGLEQREATLTTRLTQLEAEPPAAEAPAPDASSPDAEPGAQSEAADSAQRSAEREARRKELGDALAATRAQLEAARAAAAPLAILASRYEGLSPAARRALSQMGTPSDAIRKDVAAIATLAAAAGPLAARLDEVRSAVEAGRLGGFATERELLGARLAESAATLRELAAELADATAEVEDFAEQQRQRGARIRNEIADALSGRDAARIDALYVEHLDALRLLRRRAPASLGESARAARLAADLNGLVASAEVLRRVSDAEELAGSSEAALDEAEALRQALNGLETRLALDLERDSVTVLEPLASEATRSAANRLSRELLSDLRTEGLEAWRSFAGWAERTRSSGSQLRAQWRESLTTALTFLAFCGAALLFGTRRIAPMPPLVRRIAQLPFARGRVGTIVRWGSLAQAVFPALAAVGLLYAALGTFEAGRPEVWFARVVLFWSGLYIVGARVLAGSTRPVSRSRPALITLQPYTADLLGRSYRGLAVVAGLLILDEVAESWLGAGRLRILAGLLLWLWLAGWGLWAAFVWRVPLATSWERVGSAQEAAPAAWMRRSPVGFLLTPVAALRVVATRLAYSIRAILVAGGVLEFVRAKLLRRMAREARVDEAPVELPERYTKEFPLFPLLGDGEALVLPRTGPADEIIARIESWKTQRVDASLVLLGEKGVGKTTLVGQVAGRIGDLDVLNHSLSHKIIEEAELARALGPLFGAESATSIDEVIEAATARGDCVVFLDEAHNLFLRTIGGYRAFDALVRLVNATSANIFWLVVFNSFSWEFINESRGRMHYFRRLMSMPSWTADELQDLIGRRNQKTGFEVSFDPMLLDGSEGGRNDFRLIENADGFFRMLWETSRGNPRIALYYWLQSLSPVSEQELRVRLFSEPPLEKIDGLTDEMTFVLASICQHENLSAEDLSTILRMPARKSSFVIQFLHERGLIQPKHGSEERMSLSPRYYLQVLRLLRRQNLLFEGK